MSPQNGRVTATQVVVVLPRCAHCSETLDRVGWRLDTASGIGVFFHETPACMKVINCQMVALKPVAPPLIAVPGRA